MVNDVKVFVSTGGEICLAQSDADGEDLVVAVRPEEVSQLIERLQECLVEYREMLEDDPQVFEGEEQLRLIVGV